MWKNRRPGRKQRARTRVIGVYRTEVGVGATHMTIALANYLREIEGLRVALVELGSGHLSELRTKEPVTCGQVPGFRRSRVDYYPVNKLEMIRQEYDCVIYLVEDFSYIQSLWSATDLNLVFGSLAPWRCEYYAAFLRMLHAYEQDISRGKYYGLCINQPEREEMQKSYHMRMEATPYIGDPYHLRRAELASLRACLKS